MDLQLAVGEERRRRLLWLHTHALGPIGPWQGELKGLHALLVRKAWMYTMAGSTCVSRLTSPLPLSCEAALEVARRCCLSAGIQCNPAEGGQAGCPLHANRPAAAGSAKGVNV